MSSKCTKDRLRKLKDNKRFQIEKLNRCGSCKQLFNGFCEKHKHKAFNGEVACFAFEKNTDI